MREQAAPAATRPNYGLVFLFLAIFTAIEVGVSYLSQNIKIPVLLLLSGVKAALVLLYFMHLKSDSRLFAMFFVLGLALIIPLLLIFTVVMPLVH